MVALLLARPQQQFENGKVMAVTTKGTHIKAHTENLHYSLRTARVQLKYYQNIRSCKYEPTTGRPEFRDAFLFTLVRY